MARKKIKIFVSYAHKNKKLANELLDKINELLAASKNFEFEMWLDSYIDVGEKWQGQILRARDTADIGLLLVSPAFLASKFISEKELPFYVGDLGKPMLPLMLAKVDFEHHDLKGLQGYQVYRLDSVKFKEPRSYSDLKSKRRDDFAWNVFQLIHKKLANK